MSDEIEKIMTKSEVLTIKRKADVDGEFEQPNHYL